MCTPWWGYLVLGFSFCCFRRPDWSTAIALLYLRLHHKEEGSRLREEACRVLQARFLLSTSCKNCSIVRRCISVCLFNLRLRSADSQAAAGSGLAAGMGDLKVATGVDLERYQGRWYEIATIPSRFQPKDGTNTRATYTLKPDGTIGVVNETFTGGKRGSIEGVAWKADPNSDEAKLKVRFWVPPFLPIIPVTGNYYVLALDPDYRWAMVGEPTRKYLWILSREPQLSDDTYERLLELAVTQGYDVSKLHKTPQPEGGDQESKDDKHGSWWLKSMLGK